MSSQLEGSAAIVTGGGKGIGKAAAIELASKGAVVAVLDFDEAAGRETAEAIGDQSLFVRCDVSKSSEVKAAVSKAHERFGRLDILVNSAGIQRYGDAVETPEEIWDEVLNINLKSMFLTAKFCVPHMRSSGGGAIVNVASVQAFAAQRGVAAYSASKGGAVALTKAMAVDFAPEIRVNCICPGSVDTPMLREAAQLFAEDPEDALREWGAMHPMGRVARPEEIARAIAFLADPASSFVTGAALLVDGGLLATISGT